VRPGAVTINRLTYNGTGCPLGTLAVNVSEDRGALTTTFTELVAESGPGISLSAGRKNCVISMTLGVPAGWQYTLGSAYLRGFVALDAGVREPFSTSAFFAGAGATARFQNIKNGPYEGDLVASDPTAFAGLPWSPCNQAREVLFNTSVRVARVSGNSSVRGLFTNDSVDGEVTEVVGLAWRRCP